MAAVLFCLLLYLVSALFHQPAEAVSSVETNRVLLTFNTSFDTCKEITDSSGYESKSAADNACEKAFLALDETRLNTCHCWRHAECRFIPGDQHRQCTCMVSVGDDLAIKNKIVRAFRDCAPHIWAQEVATGETAAPTNNFLQLRIHYDSVWQAAVARRAGTYSGGYGGYGGGGSIGAFGSGGAGSSSGGFLPGYGNPSATYPSYGRGASYGVIPNPVGGWTDPRKIRKPHACDECGAKFRSARALFGHKKTHHSVGDTHCYLFNFTYRNIGTFLSHLRQKHPEIAAEEKASRSLPADPADAEALLPYSCPICGKRYSSKNSLVGHMKSHTSDDTKCHLCPRTFSRRDSYKRHMQNVHSTATMPKQAARGPTTSEPGIGPFVCGECGKSYAHKKGLRAHEKSHTSLETYCIICDLNFTAPKSYRMHIQSIHPDLATAERAVANERYKDKNRVKCPQCPKRFKNTRGLDDHMRFHEGKSTCEECNKVFPRKSALASHKRKEHPT